MPGAESSRGQSEALNIVQTAAAAVFRDASVPRTVLQVVTVEELFC